MVTLSGLASGREWIEILDMAYKNSGIKSFADFKGKSFAVGASGSATEMNSRDMFILIFILDIIFILFSRIVIQNQQFL